MSNLTNKIRHKDINGVKESVCGGADLCRKDKKGNTPLHVAAEEDATEIANVLIDAGAPLNEKNADGKIPSEVKPGTKTTATIQHALLSGEVGKANGRSCRGKL